MAAEAVRRFGITPKVALLSHSNFGTRDNESTMKMREVLRLLVDLDPDFEVDGEMHADAAISTFIREDNFPNSRLEGPANLLVMPTLDAAHIAFTLLRSVTKSVAIGPMMLGTAPRPHRYNIGNGALPAQHVCNLDCRCSSRIPAPGRQALITARARSATCFALRLAGGLEQIRSSNHSLY